MCGIVGIVLKNPQATNQSPSKLLRQSISKIQHRGYDGTGIAIGTSKGIKTYKNYGLINNVLADHNITNLNQNHWDGIGLAHTRYRTVGECNLESSQPLTNQKCNLSLVHNGQCKINHSIISAKEWGNLNNIIEKRKYASDSVFLLDIWDQEINRYQANDQPKMLDIIIPKILAKIFKNVRGSYSCLLNIHGYGLVAFRDPLGIRPLVVGETIDGDYYFASEDITFNHCQLKKRFDLLPGSAMVIHQTPGNLDLQVKFYQFRDGKMKIVDKNSYGDNIVAYQPCIFEYIYLAHPTSTINGFLVKNARALLGQTLADQIDRDYDVGSEIDYVIPIPESSCFSASVLARTLNLPYLELLSLNPDRKQARSFILPTQQLRENAVANKFLFETSHSISSYFLNIFK